MYPHGRSLVKRLAAETFALIGHTSDDTPQFVQEAAKEENLTWRSFFDGGGTGGPIATRWGVRSWPTIYVIDAKGVIRARAVRGEAMDRIVDELLAEAKAEAGTKRRGR